MRKIAILTLSLFILFAILLGALKSEWGKGLAERFLVEALAESGYQAKIDTIEGTIPHAIDLKGVKIESDNLTISIDSLETRLSIWALLKKELLFTDVKAEGVSWEMKPDSHPSFGKGKGLSFELRVKHFTVTDLEETTFEGAFRVGRKNRDFFLDGLATKPSFPDSKAHLIAYLEKGGLIQLKGSLTTPTLRALPWPAPFDAAVDLRFALRGKANHLAGHVSGHITPFVKELERDWKVSARILQDPNGWQLSRLTAESGIKINGNAMLGKSGQFEQANLAVQWDEILVKLEIEQKKEGIGIKGVANAPKWEHESIALENIEAKAEMLLHEGSLRGSGDAAASYAGKPWKGKADFSWEEGGSLILTDATLDGPSSHASGHLEIRPDRILLGETEIAIENLQDLPFGLYGKFQGKTYGTVSNGKQVITVDGNLTGLYWKDLFAEKVELDVSIQDPLGSPQGRVVLTGEEIKWRQLSFERLAFETVIGGQENWPFALSLSGKWKHPIELELGGFWLYQNKDLACSLTAASGSFYNHPIALAQPVDFKTSADSMHLSGLDLSLGNARLFLTIERAQNDLAANLTLERFPLDILSLNPLDVAISGETNCSIRVHEQNGKIDGTLKASIGQMMVESLGEAASGTLEGLFDSDRLALKGVLTIRETPFLDLALSLPIHFGLHPPRALLLYDKKAEGHLALKGRIEEILDFFDLGVHRVEGNIDCDFSLSNTLQSPKVTGTLLFDKGYYENYLTGTRLLDIEAEGKAQGDTFKLHSFRASDGKGSLTASGEISLLPAELFPFQFDLAFTRLQIAQIDLVNAEAEGNIQVVGNLKGALAKGEVEVIQSDLHIPDRIPRTFPNLVVVYKNQQKPIREPELFPFKPPYPLRLDLEVKAPERIYINGRGLDSEWKGNFHIGGTYTSLSAEGKLELINGEFAFSSRRFKLIDGSLSFVGAEHEMPYLNLAAEAQIKEVSIIARLKGPLNNPQLTLQSTPPLPLSTIMSYLLFGQELAEINSFQALQLANSLSSLAGQGPDVLETTRKALGVDRLNIVSVKSGDVEIEDTIAVQVGKYISEGVLVSLTQGAEESSTNINIEVELKGGWVVQLESDQRQEQGKFTIKWNHNY